MNDNIQHENTSNDFDIQNLQDDVMQTSEIKDEELLNTLNEIKNDDVNEEETIKNGSSSDSNIDVEKNEKSLSQESVELQQQIEQLKEEIARHRADYYNLQQEYSNYVRRSKADIPGYKNAGIEAVIESLLSVFDDIDAAKKHGDLEEGPFVAISNKMETSLKTSFELERYGNVGDDFDPNMHEALLVAPNPTVSKEEIGEIIQSGWKIGERIIRAAKVVVFSPTE